MRLYKCDGCGKTAPEEDFGCLPDRWTRATVANAHVDFCGLQCAAAYLQTKAENELLTRAVVVR